MKTGWARLEKAATGHESTARTKSGEFLSMFEPSVLRAEGAPKRTPWLRRGTTKRFYVPQGGKTKTNDAILRNFSLIGAKPASDSCMKYLANRLTAMVLIVLVVGTLGWLAHRFGSMEWLVENENRMREFVQQYPLQGWLLGLGFYTAFSMVPGTAGKSVVFGWIFGFLQAVSMVVIGLTIAAVASFLVSRFLVREAVLKRWESLIKKLDRNLEKDAAFYLVMMRVAHVPFSFVNYGAGVTKAKLKTFVWTTIVGLIPGTMIFVFVGTRIPTLATLAENGVKPMLDPLLISLLVATVLFPLVVKLAMYAYRNHRGEESRLDLTELDSFDEWMVKG